MGLVQGIAGNGGPNTTRFQFLKVDVHRLQLVVDKAHLYLAGVIEGRLYNGVGLGVLLVLDKGVGPL